MTQLEIQFRYSGTPTDAVIFALGSLREVYGIRRISFDRAGSVLLVEYDATRLNSATVTQLVRRTGLDLVEEIDLTPPPPPPPEAEKAAAPPA